MKMIDINLEARAVYRCRMTRLAGGLLMALLGIGTLDAVAARPNVLLILCDDLGYGDLGVLWQNQVTGPKRLHTPNLDQMAQEGTILNRHYCGAPVCAPSRSSLLSGVHQGHAFVRNTDFDDALGHNHTLGSTLRAAGYATGLIGKYGLQGDGDSPESWTAYTGSWPWIPQFRTLHPDSTRTVKAVEVTADLHRTKDAGLQYRGYIDIPAGGAWTFYATSDAGAHLRIHEAQVIDDDFNHSGAEASGTLLLEAGLHPFRLNYRTASGPPRLDWKWEGPETPKQTVPASALFRAAGQDAMVRLRRR